MARMLSLHEVSPTGHHRSIDALPPHDPAVRRPCHLVLSICIGLVLAGGQAGLLQVAAWASMLAARAASQPLATAIATTFDGDHPCCMCLAIRRHSADGGKVAPDADAKPLKLDAAPIAQAAEPFPSLAAAIPASPEPAPLSGAHPPPPVPPPTRS